MLKTVCEKGMNLIHCECLISQSESVLTLRFRDLSANSDSDSDWFSFGVLLGLTCGLTMGSSYFIGGIIILTF